MLTLTWAFRNAIYHFYTLKSMGGTDGKTQFCLLILIIVDISTVIFSFYHLFMVYSSRYGEKRRNTFFYTFRSNLLRRNRVFLIIGKPLSVRNLTGSIRTSWDYFYPKATEFGF